MRYFFWSGIVFLFVLNFSCAQKKTFFISEENSYELGVAPFRGDFSSSLLTRLDDILDRELRKRGWKEFKDYSVVKQCEEIVLSKYPEEQELKRWIEVGKCVPVKFLIVPQLNKWRERKGTRWGVIEPARVDFFLYLVDIPHKSIIKVFHFDREQKSLSENLLNIGSFLKGKGWMKAEEFFEEGVKKGLKEMGL